MSTITSETLELYQQLTVAIAHGSSMTSLPLEVGKFYSQSPVEGVQFFHVDFRQGRAVSIEKTTGTHHE